MNWLVYLFYGFVSGLGELMPVSTGAHDYFLNLMTPFDTTAPLLRLCVHLGVLAALFLFCRLRTAHIYRELRIASQPARRRKRQPDLVAVLDGRVVLTMLVPTAVSVLLTSLIRRHFDSLPMVVVLLLLSGIVIYVPHFLPGANRDSRHLSRLEALMFGVCAGLSAFPGISRVGSLLSAGGLSGCSRAYLLDIAYVLLIPVLILTIVLDLLALLAGGLTAVTLIIFFYCLLAAAAAFGGACLAIVTMRYLSVNMGYTAFAYFNWGLCAFGFILYLMI